MSLQCNKTAWQTTEEEETAEFGASWRSDEPDYAQIRITMQESRKRTASPTYERIFLSYVPAPCILNVFSPLLICEICVPLFFGMRESMSQRELIPGFRSRRRMTRRHTEMTRGAKNGLNRMALVLVPILLVSSAWATPPFGDPNQAYDRLPGTWET